MKSIHIKRIVCLLCALALGLALSACGKEKSAKVNVSQKASSNVGKVASEGYELPYTYPDANDWLNNCSHSQTFPALKGDPP